MQRIYQTHDLQEKGQREKVRTKIKARLQKPGQENELHRIPKAVPTPV
jgi:hypothetical protein